jgi:hypothetical protein
LDPTVLIQQPEWQDCLHASYFRKDNNSAVFLTAIEPIQDAESRTRAISNMLVNDWQHWHLGHTLTWTPLRDLDIIKILLRLPVKDQLDQIFNSLVSCRLIEQNQPGLAAAVSDQKNSGNVFRNLVALYRQQIN